MKQIHELNFGKDKQRIRVERDLENSTPLDVHRWSDHPEVNQFVDSIYNEHFEGRKKNIKKKHLKVVLLDLFVTWSEDDEKNIAVSRNVNDYKAGSRYNELNISKLTINVIDTLSDEGFIMLAPGYQDRKKNKGKLSRIWPAEKLINLFLNANFSTFNISNHQDRMTVVLRDKIDGKDTDVEYEVTQETSQMSELISRYNSLLQNTFIDIPTLENRNGQANIFTISQNDKFIRRIFNRGSFEFGGRFYGGWWQRCPSNWRKDIFIDDEPTTEIDFSGLHFVMLYASEGLNYWKTQNSDPYKIKRPKFLSDEINLRPLVKSLLLFVLNAKTTKQSFGAFRSNAKPGSPEKRLTDEELSIILAEVETKHPKIKKYFNADVGITLMNLDSRITELIIKHFVDKTIPILTIHDSYIVPSGLEDELIAVMKSSFEQILKTPLGLNDNKIDKSIKENQERVEVLWWPLATHVPYKEFQAKQDVEIAKYVERTNPKRSNRYKKQCKLFTDWQKQLKKKNN